jgi:hypothetical protein
MAKISIPAAQLKTKANNVLLGRLGLERDKIKSGDVKVDADDHVLEGLRLSGISYTVGKGSGEPARAAAPKAAAADKPKKKKKKKATKKKKS